VNPTAGVGFSFWRSLARAAARAPAKPPPVAQGRSSVSKEDVDSYYKQVRDWAGLTAANVSHTKRMKDKAKGERTTTGSMFTFFSTHEQKAKKLAALHANPAQLAAYQERRTPREVGGTKEAAQKRNVAMRKSAHEALAEARATYDLRARNDDGVVVPTAQAAFVFATDDRGLGDRKPPAAGRQGMDTVGVADLQKHNSTLKAQLSAEADAARVAYELRSRGGDGCLLPTEVEAFNMTQSTYVPRAATVYDGRAESNEQLAKREASQRQEMEAILEQVRAGEGA
jgi:hypothetical protein